MVAHVATSGRCAAKTAGADSPCTSACSAPTTPGGPQQPGRDLLDDPHRDQPVVAPRTAPAPGRGRGPRGRPTRRRSSGMYGGLQTTTSTVAVEVGEGVGHVAVPQVDPGPGQVARRPLVRRLAELDGVHLRPPAPRRHATARSPRSRCTGRPRRAPGRRPTTARARSTAQPASSSVSGRGHEHPGPDGELDVAEGRGAGEVLQRLPGGPTRDQRRRTPAAARR